MKKIAAVIVVLVIVAAVGAYVVLRGEEYELRLTQQQIQEKLDQIFPMTKRHLLLFEVDYSNPKVILTEGSDRIRFSLDAVLSNFATTSGQRLSGSCEMVAGLRYDADRHAFFLTDPVIEKLDLGGLPVELTPKVEQAFKATAEEVLDIRPVYTLRPTDLKKAAARAVLKSVLVEKGELVITLGL
jgi:Protein of unknown function (DUF1439)